jgi:UDP-hydrolysing UDP-N-acetyl-D-glucosamine 2-epimerase
MRKICIYVGSRANYSSLRPILQAIKKYPSFDLKIIAAAAAVVERFGNVSKLMEKDGFTIDYTLQNLVEGESPETMAKTTGLILLDVTNVLSHMKPDIVLVVGDRYDVLPVVIAAAYMNIRVAHTMGGEVTGTIDESIRHAITKLAHFHFVANQDAHQRLIRLGEDPLFVFDVGCPRNDLVLQTVRDTDSTTVLTELFEKHGGVGSTFDMEAPFILASLHPVTTEMGKNKIVAEEMLTALEEFSMNTILLWPNSDAGSEEISKSIRQFREYRQPKWLHAFKNLPVDTYVHLMNKTACLIGNSSSGIREGGILGTPVVNIGSRQNKRLCGPNVLHCGEDKSGIISALRKQLEHGKYNPCDVYGSGNAGEKIAAHLAGAMPPIQKQITH